MVAMSKKIIAKSGGQLQPERPGHFHPEKGGQFHPEKAGVLIRNIHKQSLENLKLSAMVWEDIMVEDMLLKELCK
jgi:hypothetical protein